MNSLHNCVRVLEPIGRPDAQDRPSKVFKNGLPDLVAVACRGRAVVGRSVAFDPCEINARVIRVHDAQVDTEAGDANLRPQLPTLRFDGRLDRRLEDILHWTKRAIILRRQSNRSARREVEETLEVFDAKSLGAGQVYLIRTDRREDV